MHWHRQRQGHARKRAKTHTTLCAHIQRGMSRTARQPSSQAARQAARQRARTHAVEDKGRGIERDCCHGHATSGSECVGVVAVDACGVLTGVREEATITKVIRIRIIMTNAVLVLLRGGDG